MFRKNANTDSECHAAIMRSSMVFLVLLASFQGVRSQYVEVKTEFDTNQIRIGEPFHLDINVHQPEGILVEFPDIADTLVDKVEVIRSFPADTVAIDGDLKIHKRYRLTSFASGLYVVPPMKFHFHTGIWTDSLESYPMMLLVHTVPLDSTIYDVKAPLHMPVGFLEIFPFLLGGIIFLAAAGFLFWYLRRRKMNKPVFGTSKPEDPAHIIAFRELRNLKDEKLWQQSEFKIYYTRLTEIIRRYLGRRYGIPAMEMTSYEILDVWNRSGEDRQDLSDKLNLLLNLADLVKFAKQKPHASENEENMERAFEFIEKTKWIESESEQEDDE